MAKDDLVKGLEGVVALETTLCDLDGLNGRVTYRGYDITEFASGRVYEEVAHLLWCSELPTASELGALKGALVAARHLPETVIAILHRLPRDMDPMRVLQACAAVLGGFDPDAADNGREASLRKAIRLTSRMASVTCAYHRIRHGQEPIPPSTDLSHAANFLYMLTGELPSEVSAQALNLTMVFYAEHELNASTFSARVIASTLSDMHSAVAGAIGAMRGALHGGAGEKVIATIREIGSVERVEQFVANALAAKRKLMGFGHRVYRAGDPRSPILGERADAVCRAKGTERWFRLAVELQRRVEETRGLQPNVDYYSALIWHALGIPDDLFTPVIASARVAGWTAHVLEQHEDNRLIRPRARYAGPGRRPVPRVP